MDVGPALELDRANVSYGRRVALENVSLEVHEGQSIALIGPNGAGKSTLLRAVLGLVPLASGAVRVLGRTPADARRFVAYVPQADALDTEFPVTVEQVVLMGRTRAIGWVRRPARRDHAIARDALDEVGLLDLAKVRFGTMSGGQRQRVLLARAVTQEARLLLLDEPFNGVDAVTVDVLLDVLHRLRAEGTAVVMSTHDLSVAHLACGDACLLNRRQVAVGPILETLTPARLAEAYGPQAVALTTESTIITTG
jgi:manganese/iron transport system ATP-binding protein